MIFEINKKIPLLTREEALALFFKDEDYDLLDSSIAYKFGFEYLPDNEMKDNKEYIFKNIPEGMYLTGLSVYCYGPLYPLFVSQIFEKAGLILYEGCVFKHIREHSFVPGNIYIFEHFMKFSENES